MNDITDKIMDMLDKWQWLTVAIAAYLIRNNIDPKTIPEMAD